MPPTNKDKEPIKDALDVKELTTELALAHSKINELESEVDKLFNENAKMHKELLEAKKMKPVDTGVPVDVIILPNGAKLEKY